MSELGTSLMAAVRFVQAFIFGGPVDGTAWDVKVKQDGIFHWGSRHETLVFHRGRLVVAGAVDDGYDPTRYEARQEDAGTAFAAVLAGDGRDPVEWSGTINGDKIKGVVLVRLDDGKVRRYSFHGARKSG